MSETPPLDVSPVRPSETLPSGVLPGTTPRARNSLLKEIADHHIWQLSLGFSVIIGTLATVITYRHDLCQFSGVCPLSVPATLTFSDRDTRPLVDTGWSIRSSFALALYLAAFGPVVPAPG